jgi:hypothetical protein
MYVIRRRLGDFRCVNEENGMYGVLHKTIYVVNKIKKGDGCGKL